jgi:hypothetical protein
VIFVIIIITAAGTAMLLLWGAGKYNTLVTLRQRCFGAWRDLVAGDLAVAAHLRVAGRSQDAGSLEDATHLAVANFGQSSAPDRLAQVYNAATRGWLQTDDRHLRIRAYDEAARFYNNTLRKPANRAVATLTGLRLMPVDRSRTV